MTDHRDVRMARKLIAVKGFTKAEVETRLEIAEKLLARHGMKLEDIAPGRKEIIASVDKMAEIARRMGWGQDTP